MAEIKISDLNPKGANLIATDLLVISEDIGGGLYETKSITGDEILNAVAKTAVAVRNQTGATIYKGTIVYISGTSGGKALISKAQANSEATSSKTLGVVTADIANNANGNVLTNGLLTDLDTRTTATHPFTTDTLVIGDDLYLSPTTAGYVTNVKPIAPNNLVSIGKVLETSATTGQILYAIVNGYELGELHNVDTTGAVSGNVLALNGGIWKPAAISSGITIGTTPITSGVAGRVLFEGVGNVAQEDSAFFWDNTNKRLGIGATPATNARLDIRAQGALSTDIAFRVRNSSDTLDILSVNGNGILYKPHASGNDDNENDIFVSQMSDGRNKIRLFTKGSYNLSAGIGISFQSDNGGTIKSSYTLNGAFIVANSNYQDIVGRSVFHVGGSDITQISYFKLKDYSNTNTNIFIPRSGTIVLNPDNVYSQVRGLALFGGTLGTTADRVVSIGSGTAPTTSTADNFQLWSADIVAGNAAPHFRTEDGNIIKLYKQNLPTNPTNAELATFLSNLGLANLI